MRENIVHPGAEIHTDEFPGYYKLSDDCSAHKVINDLEGITWMARCTLRELRIFGAA